MSVEASLTNQIVSVAIFLIAYGIIATEFRDRTIVAAVGGTLTWIVGLVATDEILYFVDLEVIMLLFGMMIIVGGLKQSGFFKWTGIHLANYTKLRPVSMLIVFSGITAILSAFLDNVTTVLFMVAITIEIMETLDIDPKPFIIGEMLAANTGGTATLIGGPPNIMIASNFGLSFNDFIINVAPIIVIIVIFQTTIYTKISKVKDIPSPKIRKLPTKPSDVIKDKGVFVIGTIIFALVTLLFFIQTIIGVSSTVIAFVGGMLFLGLAGNKMTKVIEEIEWNTLIFFAGLFVLIGGLETTGVIDIVSKTIFEYFGSNTTIALTAVLWLSAFSTAFVDNIPFTAAFIPVLQNVPTNSGLNMNALIYALSIGAGLGGNGTTIGSSANIVATGIAAARGHPIAFKKYVPIGLSIMVLTVLVANLYLIIMW
jgi:Na+/H+ antiporter NhaD/arsenite permease-like protein